jgi:hypothetical protein
MKWTIKMNKALQLYLASYGQMDTIGSLIKNCNMFYVSWKFWHASKLDVHALAFVAVYGLYKEIVKEAWADFSFVTKQEEMKNACSTSNFNAFHDQLAMQGLRYNPEDKRYKGDMAMRIHTRRTKAPLKEGKRRAVGQPRKNTTPNGRFVAATQVDLAQLNRLTAHCAGT